MITEVNPNYVLILPKTEQSNPDEIVTTEKTQFSDARRQNQGIVVKIGTNCTWIKVNDFVSFYRNAATDMPHDDLPYIMVHEEHCMAKIVKE